ncbi:unnamed protein product [Parajaminaea phylloscopi]
MSASPLGDSSGLWDATSSGLSNLLAGLIPAPLFTILAGFSNLIYRLILGVSNDPSSWTSTLLPPLVALLAAYFALVLAYRTVRSTILVVWWGLKWGAIIGAGVALWAWWVGEGDAVRSPGEVPGSTNWLNAASSLVGLAGTTPLLSAAQHFLRPQARPDEGRRRSGRSQPGNRAGRRTRDTTFSPSSGSEAMDAIYEAARAAAGNSDTASPAFSRRSTSRGRSSSSDPAAPPLADLLQTLGVNPALIASITSGDASLPSTERLQEWLEMARQGGSAWLGQNWGELLSQVSESGSDAATDGGPSRNTRSRTRGQQRGQSRRYADRRGQDGQPVDPAAQAFATAGRAGRAVLRSLFGQ